MTSPPKRAPKAAPKRRQVITDKPGVHWDNHVTPEMERRFDNNPIGLVKHWKDNVGMTKEVATMVLEDGFLITARRSMIMADWSEKGRRRGGVKIIETKEPVTLEEKKDIAPKVAKIIEGVYGKQ